MKALSCIAPGKLEFVEIANPKQKNGNSILKIKRIGICGTDLHAFEGTQPYFNYPRILGHELAGEIVETDLADFKKGESVTIIPYFNCGHCIACRSGKPNCCAALEVFGVHIDGGMAEYISVPSYSLLHARGLSIDALALVEPFAIGAHAIRRAAIQKNEFVLIAGAGPIGLGVAAFAKIAGAQVIMMDVNKHRLGFCSAKLGISHIINAAEENIFEQLKSITNADMPTVVIDATGNQKAINSLFQYMAHGARYILVGLQKEIISISHPEFHKREATLMSSRNATKEDFEQVIQSMKSGLIDSSAFITHRINFSILDQEFQKLFNPDQFVIKAMITLD
ncbi:MAG: zinc-binding alcohol dehydrogenase family protein [Bacteroidetes bacterium]|nr:zinc-binding alcohol dehydrogenase family protein [Bacteroidota bacterium]